MNNFLIQEADESLHMAELSSINSSAYSRQICNQLDRKAKSKKIFILIIEAYVVSREFYLTLIYIIK